MSKQTKQNSIEEKVRKAFPSNPHEEQTHAIQGELDGEFMREAASQGWVWVAVSIHGTRFMYLYD